MKEGCVAMRIDIAQSGSLGNLAVNVLYTKFTRDQRYNIYI